jgi:hypothetical protein
MPTRRTFELVVLVVVLSQPALALVKLWTRKHLVTTANSASSDAAKVVNTLL